MPAQTNRVKSFVPSHSNEGMCQDASSDSSPTFPHASPTRRAPCLASHQSACVLAKANFSSVGILSWVVHLLQAIYLARFNEL